MSVVVLFPPTPLVGSVSRWRRVRLALGGAGEPPAAHVRLPIDRLSGGPQLG